MLLAINANNTNTVSAVWDGVSLTGVWRAATDGRRTADEYVVWLDHLLGLQNLSRRQIDGAVIASVVPEANFNLRRLCREDCRSDPLVVAAPHAARPAWAATLMLRSARARSSTGRRSSASAASSTPWRLTTAIRDL